MILQKLRLINFKNYQDATLSPSQGINCIIGTNGSGKTNLLDAIHYISMTKSAFNAVDSQNIKEGEKFFSILGDFDLGESSHHVRCSVETGKRKVLEVDDNSYERLSEHVGRFPNVLMAPHHHDLVYGSSENRRRFFDGIISQMDNGYLDNLLAYNHNLKQRNSLLRYFHDTMSIDEDLLEPYDQKLISLGRQLYESRKHFLESFMPLFKKRHEFISEEKEHCSISYQSQFGAGSDEAELKSLVDRELEAQRSLFGIHRDKWELEIDGHPLKKFGSQGQQKTFMLALLLAYFDVLSEHKGFSPVLLLDDIFDKLDDHRIHRLMEVVSSKPFEQIFLTDARPERSRTILSSLGLDATFVVVDDGTLTPE